MSGHTAFKHWQICFALITKSINIEVKQPSGSFGGNRVKLTLRWTTTPWFKCSKQFHRPSSALTFWAMPLSTPAKCRCLPGASAKSLQRRWLVVVLQVSIRSDGNCKSSPRNFVQKPSWTSAVGLVSQSGFHTRDKKKHCFGGSRGRLERYNEPSCYTSWTIIEKGWIN